MVTNHPQQRAAAADVRNNIEQDAGILERAIGKLSQFLCGLRGHDSVLHFEGNRVMMRCTSCGHDTPGWEISGQGPRKRYDGDARRHLLAPQRLVLRKTA